MLSLSALLTTRISNVFENGTFIETGGSQAVANDFTVSANTMNFSATSITANLLTQEDILTVDLTFYADAEGAPGDEITDETLTGVVPISQEVVGAAFGYDVRAVVIDFDAIEFPGTGVTAVTYWVQISGQTASTPTAEENGVAWEVRSTDIIGCPMFFNQGNGWISTGDTDGGPDDAVFSISGDCTMAEGCLVPENVTVSNATASSFDVMWSEVGTAVEWVVEYGETAFAEGTGTEVTVEGVPGVTIEDLDGVTTYDIYVRSICTDGESASVLVTSMTVDFYCTPVVTADVEAITKVEFAGISNTADPNSTTPNEYFFDMVALVTQNDTLPIALEGLTNGSWTNSFVVFIDWNQDMEFDNDDERYEIGVIEDSDGTDGIQATGNIAVPEDALIGDTRMRIVKMFTGGSSYAEDACADIGFGQSHDYTVNVDVASSVNFAEYNFALGPNPTSDVVQITATENIQSIKVYNLLGQQVLNNQVNVQSPQINMASLENGVYLMEVTIKDTKEVFKIVKQ